MEHHAILNGQQPLIGSWWEPKMKLQVLEVQPLQYRQTKAGNSKSFLDSSYLPLDESASGSSAAMHLKF